jgi:hypothetical protein
MAAPHPRRSAVGRQEGLLFPTPPPAAGKVVPECRLRGRQLPCQPAVVLRKTANDGRAGKLRRLAAPHPKRSAVGRQEGLLFPTPSPAAGKVAPECRLRGRQLPCQPAVVLRKTANDGRAGKLRRLAAPHPRAANGAARGPPLLDGIHRREGDPLPVGLLATRQFWSMREVPVPRDDNGGRRCDAVSLSCVIPPAGGTRGSFRKPLPDGAERIHGTGSATISLNSPVTL